MQMDSKKGIGAVDLIVALTILALVGAGTAISIRVYHELRASSVARMQSEREKTLGQELTARGIAPVGQYGNNPAAAIGESSKSVTTPTAAQTAMGGRTLVSAIRTDQAETSAQADRGSGAGFQIGASAPADPGDSHFNWETPGNQLNAPEIVPGVDYDALTDTWEVNQWDSAGWASGTYFPISASYHEIVRAADDNPEGTQVFFTLDGSDPRYSPTRKELFNDQVTLVATRADLDATNPTIYLFPSEIRAVAMHPDQDPDGDGDFSDGVRPSEVRSRRYRVDKRLFMTRESPGGASYPQPLPPAFSSNPPEPPLLQCHVPYFTAIDPNYYFHAWSSNPNGIVQIFVEYGISAGAGATTWYPWGGAPYPDILSPLPDSPRSGAGGGQFYQWYPGNQVPATPWMPPLTHLAADHDAMIPFRVWYRVDNPHFGDPSVVEVTSFTQNWWDQLVVRDLPSASPIFND